MNSPLFFFLLSLCVGIPFLVGMFRIKTLSDTNRVFIYFLGVGVLSEILFYYLPNNELKYLDYNVYYLLEFLFVMYFNYQNRVVKEIKKFRTITIIGILVWIVNMFTAYQSKIPIFHAYSLFFIVITSIDTINDLYFDSYTPLLTDSKFIIASCFILFYTLCLIDTCFNIFKIGMSSSFKIGIFYIKAITNFVVNLIFIVAIIWMPQKKKYT